MDEKDGKLIETLMENSGLSYRQIARETGIPITTVYKRIREMKAGGVIRRFTIDVDYAKVGKPLCEHILISCDFKLLRELKKDQHALAKEIKRLPGIESVDVVTGEVDLAAKVRVRDVSELDEFLVKKLDKTLGIDRTKTLVSIYEA